MQHLAGLSALRALHVVQFRNDDTCIWAIRETKRYLIDNVSHYPDLPLEWVSIDDEDRVDHLLRVRRQDGTKKNKKKKSPSTTGKGKQTAASVTSLAAGLSMGLDPAVVAAELLGGSVGESSSEEENGGFAPNGTRMETVEGVPFWDVYGIKIFQKEIVAGRL